MKKVISGIFMAAVIAAAGVTAYASVSQEPVQYHVVNNNAKAVKNAFQTVLSAVDTVSAKAVVKQETAKQEAAITAEAKTEAVETGTMEQEAVTDKTAAVTDVYQPLCPYGHVLEGNVCPYPDCPNNCINNGACLNPDGGYGYNQGNCPYQDYSDGSIPADGAVDSYGGNGYGYGNGYGNGNGEGWGNGYGCGHGNGYGHGCGRNR